VVYHNAFEVALRLRGIPYQSEVITPVMYKGHCVGFGRVDLMIHYLGVGFILELKALQNFNADTANTQILNYLTLHKCTYGMVINFCQKNNASGGEVQFKYFHKTTTQEYDIYNYSNGTFVKKQGNEMTITN
jgi:GxxExxY protein